MCQLQFAYPRWVREIPEEEAVIGYKVLLRDTLVNHAGKRFYRSPYRTNVWDNGKMVANVMFTAPRRPGGNFNHRNFYGIHAFSGIRSAKTELSTWDAHRGYCIVKVKMWGQVVRTGEDRHRGFMSGYISQFAEIIDEEVA